MTGDYFKMSKMQVKIVKLLNSKVVRKRSLHAKVVCTSVDDNGSTSDVP